MTNERIKTIKINKKKILSRLRKKTKSMMISSLSSEDPWCNDFLANCCNCCPDIPEECPSDCSQCPNTITVKYEFRESGEGPHTLTKNGCAWYFSFNGNHPEAADECGFEHIGGDDYLSYEFVVHCTFENDMVKWIFRINVIEQRKITSPIPGCDVIGGAGSVVVEEIGQNTFCPPENTDLTT